MAHLQRCSVFGLGKLGAPLVAVLGSRGFPVCGCDVNPATVQRVAAGEAPVAEPGLEALFAAHRANIAATMDPAEAVAASDVTFIIVPTPSDATGRFSTRYVEDAARQIGAALRDKAAYHLVVLTSTVMPGDTEGVLVPLLESESGKQCGRDFGVCYNPEFIALGSVIRDMLNPDFLLIGAVDERAGDLLEGLYARVCDNSPAVARMNAVNAEITKLAVNTYLTTKITYANMLADVCERTPGADVSVVTSAIGRDTRIGAKYLQGGLGYGGPCFPRDNVAFCAMAQAVGANAGLAEATHALNRRQVERLYKLISSLRATGGAVGILGLSYKPDTDVVEESQGLLLARRLVEAGCAVVVYDPAAQDRARRELGDAVTYGADSNDCIRRSDLVAVTTAWKEFRELSAEQFVADGRPRTLVDCWRLYPRDFGDARLRVVHPGLGPAPAAGAGAAALDLPTAAAS